MLILYANGFVRSGWVNLHFVTLRYFGHSDDMWSNTVLTYGTDLWGARAYHLNFSNFSVNPSDNYTRWDGFPVRCLVYYVVGLFFVRSGHVSIGNGSLGYFGREGSVWPRTSTGFSSTTDANAYRLLISIKGVTPTTNTTRRFGYPVRCLVY